MFTVTLQIDEKKIISIDSESSNGAQKKPSFEELYPTYTPRKIHSFMSHADQYCKAEDVYWYIDQYKTIHPITKNRYYERRKSAGYFDE